MTKPEVYMGMQLVLVIKLTNLMKQCQTKQQPKKMNQRIVTKLKEMRKYQINRSSGNFFNLASLSHKALEHNIQTVNYTCY